MKKLMGAIASVSLVCSLASADGSSKDHLDCRQIQNKAAALAELSKKAGNSEQLARECLGQQQLLAAEAAVESNPTIRAELLSQAQAALNATIIFTFISAGQ